MTQFEELDTECRSAHCDSTDVLMIFEELRSVGSQDVQAVAAKGAECQECGLKFHDEEIRETAREMQTEKNRKPKDL